MSYLAKSVGSVVVFVGLTFSLAANAADMVEGYVPPKTVVHHRTYHPAPPRHHRIVKTEQYSQLDCGKVIYEYRSAPQYTEVKTVCSPPWAGPTGSAESGYTGSAGATAVQ